MGINEAIELIKFRATEALDMPPPEDNNIHETERTMYSLRDALNDIRLVIAQTVATTDPKSVEAARAWYDSQPTFGDWLAVNSGPQPGSEQRVR